MLLNVIDTKIHAALKEGNAKRAESIRLIKAELLKQYKAGKPEDYTEEKELKTLLKLKAQIEDSIEQYTKANREELAEKERFDLSVLSEFLPKEATEEEIVEATNKAIDELGRKPTMSDMKTIMVRVKEAFPTANGKIISETLKERAK